MKIPFALLYTFNLLRKNLIKTIACILVAVVAPFLNSLKDIRNEDKIDYQYQKDGQYFYVTQDISNNEFTYEVQTFDKVPQIKNGKIISYSYNEGIYYYFYDERFLGKSDRPLHNECRYIARDFRIYNMTNIKSCPVWKTKTQNRASKLEEIGV